MSGGFRHGDSGLRFRETRDHVGQKDKGKTRRRVKYMLRIFPRHLRSECYLHLLQPNRNAECATYESTAMSVWNTYGIHAGGMTPMVPTVLVVLLE